MRIVASFNYPPDPNSRSYDWSAWDDDRLDGAPDAGEKSQRMGIGATPNEAMLDLAERAHEDYAPEQLHEAEGYALDRGDTLTLRFIDAVRALEVA